MLEEKFSYHNVKVISADLAFDFFPHGDVIYYPSLWMEKVKRRIFLLLLAVGDSGISGIPSLLIELKAEGWREDEDDNKTRLITSQGGCPERNC